MNNNVAGLKQYYKDLPWYQQWFFPNELKKVLENANSADASVSNSISTLMIINAAFHSTWFFQKWFYVGLGSFFAAPAVKPCQWLYERKLLTNTVVDNNSSEAIATFLREVQEAVASDNAGLVTLKITEFQQWMTHSDTGLELNGLVRTLQELNQARLLSPDQGLVNLNAALIHPDPINVAQVLALLKSLNLLDGIQGQANFNLMVANTNILAVYQALSMLRDVGLLDVLRAQENIQIVMNNQTPSGVAQALRLLRAEGLLDIENFNTVVAHVSPSSVAEGLIKMHRMGLLSSPKAAANRLALVAQSNPKYIADVLFKLSDEWVGPGKAQAAFESIISHAAILCGVDQARVWENVSLTLVRWIEMLVLCHWNRDQPDVGKRVWMQYAETAQLNGRSRQDLNDFADDPSQPNVTALLNNANARKPVNVGKQDPDTLAIIICQLKQAGLLDNESAQNNLDLVLASNHLKDLVCVIGLAKKNGLFDPARASDIFIAALACKKPSETIDILRLMDEVGLLATSANLIAVMTIKNLNGMFAVLRVMARVHLLHAESGQVNFAAILAHQRWDLLNEALLLMENSYLQDSVVAQDNVTAIFQRVDLEDFIVVLKNMAKLRMDNIFCEQEEQANFEVVVAYPEDSQNALDALCLLKREGLLNNTPEAQANRNVLLHAHSRDPLDLAQALVELYRAAMLAPNDAANDNRRVIIEHEYPMEAAKALMALNESNLLLLNEGAEANRNALIISINPVITAKALIKLHQARLLYPNESAEENRLLLTHAYPLRIVDALIKLHERNCLPSGTVGAEIRRILLESQDPMSEQTINACLACHEQSIRPPLGNVAESLGQLGMFAFAEDVVQPPRDEVENIDVDNPLVI